MKRCFAAFLGLIMLTGCQGHIRHADTEPTAKGIHADRDNVPAVRYIEGTIADAGSGSITRISFIDSDGNRFMSEDDELLRLSFNAITERYAKGELSGYTAWIRTLTRTSLTRRTTSSATLPSSRTTGSRSPKCSPMWKPQ